MCGIAGCFTDNRITENEKRHVQAMTKALQHRGPDDEGYFSDTHCALGHQRLAVIDLSKDGHQPFVSDNDRYQMVYNGEIFNYRELRLELKDLGWGFRTQTDTEVVLKAYQQFGPECLSKFNGMFAFVIYDRKEHALFLARDRFGIKPLYYWHKDTTFYFASELKAFASLPQRSKSINPQALFDYCVFNRTDVFDETFFNDIKRIPKAHCAVYNKEGLNIHRWWNAADYLTKAEDFDLDDVSEQLQNLLQSSIALRMRSDVPVGSCLSGGLDSSILTALLKKQNLIDDTFKTFTAAFPGWGSDESEYVDELTQTLGFQNYKVFPNAQKAFDEVRDFVYANDEPTWGATCYAQYAVMQKAKEEGITVLLDGQGADESFAGYHYMHGLRLMESWKTRKYGRWLQDLMGLVMRGQHISAYQTFVFQTLSLDQRKKLLYKRVPFLNRDFFYDHVESSKIFTDFFSAESLNDFLVNHFQYKLEHLLRVEDRNSMNFSLESRVPYLDHRLVEFILSLPSDYKIKNGHTKWIQKHVFKNEIPEKILNRKDKIGFAAPMDEWMDNPAWISLSQRSHNELKSVVSKTFNSKSNLPKRSAERWKMCQLSFWMEQFLN